MPIVSGTRLGRYQIRSKLGEGGMGEVYLAQDTKLDRTVALKVLPADLAHDQSRMRRFVQEARTASSLSHPNVAHIYEIEDIDGVHFIAMEFIDGDTLRHRISRSELPLHEVLEIAMQVAAGLSAAHAAGITHRDIKPDNVMLRHDGYVKVLDFGLAKLADRSIEADKEAPTRAMVNTDPGTVMGTVGYMSPEQARGQSTDARTDIWSLGVVIYQMVTHHLPFEGSSNSDVIASILGKEPPPLARYARDAPEALEWIVTKALTKEADERYQTAKEMMVDLRRIKQRLEAHAEIERSSAPESAVLDSAVSTPTQTVSSQSTAQPVQAATAVSSVPPASSAELIVSEIKRHKTGVGLIAAIIFIAIAGGAFLIYKLGSSNKPVGRPGAEFTGLTSGGRVGSELIVGGANISPDGKYVVFATADEQGRTSLYVRQVSTNNVTRIAGPTETTNGAGTTFSPDSEFVYFNASDKNNPDGALFRVSFIGGAPQRILQGIWGPVSFSPDAKQVCYVRLFPSTGESWLVIANTDGSGTPRTIAKRKLPDYFSSAGPSWSPDGKRIAVGVQSIPEIGNATVVEVPVEGGPEHQIAKPQWSQVFRVNWIKDGSGLIFTANSSYTSTGDQIWFLSYPEGVAERVTHDLNGYGQYSVGLTADSKTIVTVQYEFNDAIWLATPNEDSGKARQISTGKYDGSISLGAAPDGRIAYVDFAGNGNEIFTLKSDGSDKRQVTSDGAIKNRVSVTPDGRYLLFDSNRSGNFNIWRADFDGSNQKQITTNETFAAGAVASADGKWIVYQALRNGRWDLLKMPGDGGEATRMMDRQCLAPAISPDEKAIACFSPDEQAGFKWQIAIVPFEGGPVSKYIEVPQTVVGNSQPLLCWTPDGRAITYIDGNGFVQNIFAQPIDGGSRKQLTSFKTDYIGTFTWTRDGKQLILGRGPSSEDVVLIKNFR
jgi:serine/threonine protein kinase/Tol biopolymer transport system component